MRTIEELRDIWKRLENPQTAEDYGLSIKLSEMRRLPEARRTLALLPLQGVRTVQTKEESE